MSVVIAIPTIKERGDAWKEVGRRWVDLTPEPLVIAPSWRPGSWSAGLNEVWEQHRDASVMVLASDDMEPEDDTWLTHALYHLDKEECPVPTMLDPRMTTIGGTQDVYWKQEPYEGAPARMTNFPILKARWFSHVFPLPEQLHYYSDNLIGDRLAKAGVPLVTCLGIRIVHAWDARGRGAGLGSEEARMAYDREIYQNL